MPHNDLECTKNHSLLLRLFACISLRIPWAMCKSRVYDAVQEAASRVPGLKREQVFEGLRTPALGANLTTVKCQGAWLTLGISIDAISELTLTVDRLSAQDITALKHWIEPIAQSVGAQC
jgi:hypothetical protein